MQLIASPVHVLQELVGCRSVSTDDAGQHAAMEKIVNILEKILVQR